MSNPIKSVRLLGLLIVVVLLPCTTLFAQSDSATISGRVTDQSGAVLIGASVEMTDVATGVSISAVTNSDGIYVFSNLHPGLCRMVVKQDGFRNIVLSDLVLNVQDALSRNFTMQIGNRNESITVTSSEIEEHNLSPAVSTVVNQQFVQNMPLNGRTFQSLLALTPGYVMVVTSDAVGGAASGQFSVNGQRANANYFMVDGVSANFAIYNLGQSAVGTIPAFTIEGTTSSLVSVDAMQEFRVQTSTFAPEFGRTPGAQISIVTRSGSNQFHGTAFDYLRNDAFDARNYFDAPPLPKPPLRQNDFGGTFGGPVLKDRAFFFFSYEGLRLRLPATSTGNFYTVAARTNVAPVFQPLLASLPIPNGPVNSDGLTAPLTMTYSDPSSFDSYSVRLDYNVNNWITLFARYGHSPSTASTHNYSDLENQSSNVDVLTVGATMTLGPEKVNDFRANWSRSVSNSWSVMTPFYGGVPPPVSSLFPPGYSSTTYRFVLLPGGQDGQIRNGGAIDRQRQLEFADSLSMSAGTHQLKFGGDLRQLTPTSGMDTNGSLVFSSYIQLQAGVAGSVGTFGGVTITAGTYNYSLFAQDVWRATNRLTLTYGLRWEINTPLASITPAKPLYAVNGIFNSKPFGLAPAGTPLWHTRFNNFAPRFGAAYQATQQTVLRGGFGLFYDIGYGGGVSGTMNDFPYSLENFVGSGPVPFDFSNPAFAPPPFTLVPNASTFYIDAVDPKLQPPLVYGWNAAIEQALGPSQSISVTYVGSHGTRLLREDAIQNNSSGSPTVFVTRNADWSNYNALQMQFRRRMSRGLQALASYTLAKSMDTNSTDVCQCTTSNSLKNIDVARDYGPSNFDVRNSFAAAVSYEVPSPKWNSTANALLRNWALYGILHVNSAPPFTVKTFGSSPVFGSYLTRPDVVPGVPFYIPDAQPGGRILNAAAFTSPPTGAQGDLPRNYFRGFPIDQLDLAVSRRFGLSERVSLFFRVEYFNVFNHPMFAPPSANFNNFLFNAGFGQITTTLNNFLGGTGSISPLYAIGGPRSGQFTLKLQF